MRDVTKYGIPLGFLFTIGMVVLAWFFFEGGKSSTEVPDTLLATQEVSPVRDDMPTPMVALGDYVKITDNPEEWEYQIVATVEYHSGMYVVTFMDGSGLHSEHGEWGYSVGAEFKPVKLAIANLTFREIQGIPSPLEVK